MCANGLQVMEMLLDGCLNMFRLLLTRGMEMTWRARGYTGRLYDGRSYKVVFRAPWQRIGRLVEAFSLLR